MELKKRALIFELKFHQEIIPAQIFFLLDEGYDVHLFLDARLYDRDLFNGLKNKITLTLLPQTKGLINKAALLFKVKKYVEKNQISHLILNTLDSNFNNFLLRLTGNLHTVGIVHQLQKLKHKLLYYDNFKRVLGVLTLSQYTLQYLTQNYKPEKPVSFFYPIFFPYHFKENCLNHATDQDVINIAIPGQLDQSKRDYRSLIKILAANKDQAIRFKFFLLGNASRSDGPAIIQAIKDAGIEQLFSYTEGFVTYNDFFSFLSRAHYVMPLLNAKIQQLPTYHASQISASFNWAYAFQKPLLIHEFYLNNVVNKSESVSYGDENLGEALLNLEKFLPETEEIKDSFFDFKFQKRNYLKVF